jgi:hypothetical protein
MSSKLNNQNVSFHEASVTRLSSEQESVVLELEGVTTRERTTNASVTVHGVTEITVDGSPTNAVAMEYEDGEVLTLDVGPNNIRLIVEWNDFGHRRSCTRSYAIRGAHIDIALHEDSARS